MTELSPPGRFKGFLRELKRRKVYQVGAVYVVVGFAVAQGAEYLFEMIGLPVVASRAVLILAILGLPLALVLAWAYELRPDEGPSEGASLPEGSVATPSSERALPEAGASIVVFGHWHIPLVYEEAGVLVINPGALAQTRYHGGSQLDGRQR